MWYAGFSKSGNNLMSQKMYFEWRKKMFSILLKNVSKSAKLDLNVSSFVKSKGVRETIVTF